MQKKTQTIKKLLGKISMIIRICYFQLKKKPKTYLFLESEDRSFFLSAELVALLCFMH